MTTPWRPVAHAQQEHPWQYVRGPPTGPSTHHIPPPRRTAAAPLTFIPFLSPATPTSLSFSSGCRPAHLLSFLSSLPLIVFVIMASASPPPYTPANFITGRPYPSSSAIGAVPLSIVTASGGIEMLPQGRYPPPPAADRPPFSDVRKEADNSAAGPYPDVDKFSGGPPPMSPLPAELLALQLQIEHTKVLLAKMEADRLRADRDYGREEEEKREERYARLQRDLRRDEHNMTMERERRHAETMAFHSKAPTNVVTTVAQQGPALVPQPQLVIYHNPWYRRCWVWTVISIVGVVIIVIASVAGAASHSSNGSSNAQE